MLFHTFYWKLNWCFYVTQSARVASSYVFTECFNSYFSRLLVKFPELNYQLKIKVCIDK